MVFLMSLILHIELGLCKYLTGTDSTVALDPFPVTWNAVEFVPPAFFAVS